MTSYFELPLQRCILELIYDVIVFLREHREQVAGAFLKTRRVTSYIDTSQTVIYDLKNFAHFSDLRRVTSWFQIDFSISQSYDTFLTNLLSNNDVNRLE
jgi:hypothetical protein